MRLGRGGNSKPKSASIAVRINSAQPSERVAAGFNGTPAVAWAATGLACLLLTGSPAPVLAAAANATPSAAETPIVSPPDTAAATVVPATAPANGATSPTSPAPDAAASTLAVVQQPRAFGYVLGDTLTQRILLGLAGTEFQPASLPPSERAGLWFARRSSKIEKTDDNRHWLAIDYQLVNAPQTLTTVDLPAVTLKSKAGDELVVPLWPISVSPLTPRAAFAKGGLQELRPDHPAPILPTSTLRRQLEIWLIAFAATIATWLGWWLVRTVRAAANQPFASALREIRRTGDDSATAWLALHRAFDRTAGRALQTITLPAFFKRAPHFENQRKAIEQFYAESNLRFFGVTNTAGGPTRTGSNTTSADATAGSRAMPTPSGASNANGATMSLRTLATTLRRLEKQHER